jgi:hypothetical protein
LTAAALTFTAVMVGLMSAFGLYRHEANYSPTVSIIRTSFAVTINFTAIPCLLCPTVESDVSRPSYLALLPGVASLLLTRPGRSLPGWG